MARWLNLFESASDVSASRAPRVALLRVAFDLTLGAIFGLGLAALIFFLAWRGDRNEWWLIDKEFTALIVLCAIGGIAAQAAAVFLWSEARARVTPWLVAAAALTLGSSWLAQLLPDGAHAWSTQAQSIQSYALFGQLGLLFVAAIALIDWRIARQERRELQQRELHG